MKNSVSLVSFFMSILHFFFLGSVYSQQPGGVSGTIIWYATEKGTSTYTLKDRSGNSWPSYGSNTVAEIRNINFHPAIYFNSNIQVVKFSNVSFNQGTIVGIFYPDKDNYKTKEFISADYKNEVEKNIKVSLKYNSIDTNGNRKFLYGEALKRTTFEVNTSNTQHDNSMKTGVYYLGRKQKPASIWGAERSISLNSTFKGYIPELIIYNRVLSPLDRSKVESYLAMKYGITLDTSYIDNDGRMLWDANDSITKLFHSRVSAIAKNSSSALWQPNSNTSYEQGYGSYDYNSYGLGLANGITSNYQFIPKLDTPSLYRSLTIGFSDKSLKSVSERSYILWGDNNRPELPQEKYLSINGFKNAEIIQRIWMINNPGKITNSLKIVISGRSYKERKTLFEKIYQPYNYQFYRYVLVKLNSPNSNDIDTTKILLNNYFGREQPTTFNSKQTFNTRSIIWDSITLNGSITKNYFTFGRVPLLTFWSVGKVERGAKKYDSISLYYPYYTDRPIRAQTDLDTAIRKFKIGDSLRFRISVGVPPIEIKYKDSSKTNWNLLNNLPDINLLDTLEIAPVNDTVSNEELETELVVRGSGTKSFITRQKWRKKLPSEYFSIPGLEPSKTYIIQATDKVGQKSTLTVRLKSN